MKVYRQIRDMLAVAGAVLALGAVTALAQSVFPIPGPTAQAVQKRGALKCGIDTGIPGFAFQGSDRKWQGFDVDYCRAIAAAVLGSPDKVDLVPTTSLTRFTLLQSGDIDVLLRDSTLTYTRGVSLGLSEVAVNFFAAQSLMIRKSLGVTDATKLDGATICTLAGSDLEFNLGDFASAHSIKIATLTFDKSEEGVAAAEAGRCDGYSDDTGSLAAERSTMRQPADWIIMDVVLNKEPLGPHVRQGDERWRDIVFWVDDALKTAEEYGITQANIDSFRTSPNPAYRRFLGFDKGLTKLNGLDDAWVYNVVKGVGNYGEIYDRYFGPKALNLPRGANNLFTRGGLQYALPLR